MSSAPLEFFLYWEKLVHTFINILLFVSLKNAKKSQKPKIKTLDLWAIYRLLVVGFYFFSDKQKQGLFHFEIVPYFFNYPKLHSVNNRVDCN